MIKQNLMMLLKNITCLQQVSVTTLIVFGLISKNRVRILNHILQNISEYALKMENIFKMETGPITKDNILL